VLTSNSVIARCESIMFSDLDGQTIMLNIETGEYYDIDPVGSDIWTRIEQPKSVADICKDLSQIYAVKLEKCQEDVLPFLSELADLGAIEISQ
jgi:hypothetical protein